MFCKVVKPSVRDKVIVYQKNKNLLTFAKTSRQEFESYSVTAVRHEVTHLHVKEGFRETDSSNCFTRVVWNHLEMRSN